MNKYLKLKKRHQKELNDFPFGFCFSEKQFEEMMRKFGLNPKDTDKIYSIGAGGYIRKSDSSKMEEMFARQRKEMLQEIEKDKTGKGFIYDMFSYELANHEYCVTYSLYDTLDALGLTYKQVQSNQNLYTGLMLALKEYK